MKTKGRQRNGRTSRNFNRISQLSSLAASLQFAPSKIQGKEAPFKSACSTFVQHSSAFHHRLCNWEARWLFVFFFLAFFFFPIMSLSDKPPLSTEQASRRERQLPNGDLASDRRKRERERDFSTACRRQSVTNNGNYIRRNRVSGVKRRKEKENRERTARFFSFPSTIPLDVTTRQNSRPQEVVMPIVKLAIGR